MTFFEQTMDLKIDKLKEFEDRMIKKELFVPEVDLPDKDNKWVPQR